MVNLMHSSDPGHAFRNKRTFFKETVAKHHEI